MLSVKDGVDTLGLKKLTDRVRIEIRNVCVSVFFATCNDISVIYVTAQMCRRTEEVVPTAELPTPLTCLWRHCTGPSLSISQKQKRNTEGCSKFKSPETRQVQERLVSTLEHMQIPKWDRTRCPEE